jgi:hypothetical protein
VYTDSGGILTVADDLLKNDGKKFLEMMERLAERRMQREEEAAAMERDYYEEEEDDDDDEYEDDGEEVRNYLLLRVENCLLYINENFIVG